jgi:hypothetical protein
MSSHELALVAALRKEARALEVPASQVAELLAKYASEIEAPATAESSLVKFHAFAWHYKGLRDLVVPNIGESEWVTFVESFRVLSRKAVRARNLDRSLLGRVHSFFSSLARQ